MMALVSPAPNDVSRSWQQRVLGMPLVWKLLGANSLIALAAVSAFAVLGRRGLLETGILILAVGFAANALLVHLALRPLRVLQETAQRVSEGDSSARVAASPIADRRMAELGASFNRLLSRVESDRARIQHLVRQSLKMREEERAAIAGELREATAQQLAALAMHLSAATRECPTPELAPSLLAARDIATRMVEDVRGVAESVYPGLLGEFGLGVALKALASRVSQRTNLDVRVIEDGSGAPMSATLMTALYCVAEEALLNAERHAHAAAVRITLLRQGREARLQIDDDGLGFNVEQADRMSQGVGLFRARELLAHAGGRMQISSAPGSGTTVVALATVSEEMSSDQ